jgi:hypothetical protein
MPRSYRAPAASRARSSAGTPRDGHCPKCKWADAPTLTLGAAEIRVLRRGASGFGFATMRNHRGRRRGDFLPRLTRPGRRPAAAVWLLAPVLRGSWRGGRALTWADRVWVPTFLVLRACQCPCVSVRVCRWECGFLFVCFALSGSDTLFMHSPRPHASISQSLASERSENAAGSALLLKKEDRRPLRAQAAPTTEASTLPPPAYAGNHAIPGS